MDGHSVGEMDCEKGLWIIFSIDLKTADHYKEAFSKVNRMFGLINRPIKYKHHVTLTKLTRQ